jgi:hypothetical protein
MNKYHAFLSFYLVGLATIINTLFRENCLPICMSYNFLLSCIMLCFLMAIAISYLTSMMSRLIMVAFNTENKLAITTSYMVVLHFKFRTMMNISKWWEKWIAYKAYHQIKDIYSTANATKDWWFKLNCLGVSEN